MWGERVGSSLGWQGSFNPPLSAAIFFFPLFSQNGYKRFVPFRHAELLTPNPGRPAFKNDASEPARAEAILLFFSQ